ncbi:hypothetical protein K2Z83_21070 [Oscillochloris sp. ZM17-4]|uniref:hypothetical protein n=1 Tax=Oscillochloris sp. ZM17-4 TaxID=2866714 RepID=UPI001C72F994|nr:hypothetical protein [Oscillochloris sp. ZM17-4]MBX0330164.1 hypothetical protein [Oscillochloris sp. ZM17-4]
MIDDSAISRRRWSVIGALLPLIAVILVAAVRAGERRLDPAPGLQLVATVDLAEGPFDEVVLAHLALTETVSLKLRLALRQIDTPSLELSLQSEAGVRRAVMRAEGLRTSKDGGADWEEVLPPGDYRLVLSAAQSPGTLAVYASSVATAPNALKIAVPGSR